MTLRRSHRAPGRSSIRRLVPALVAVLSLAALGGAPAAPAATIIDYPDFSNTSGLTLNGSAAQAGDRLRLTPALTDQAGSAWSETLVPVGDSFSTQFAIEIHDGNGGDGMTFALQSSGAGPEALGPGGGYLGYEGIAPSVAVEFDIFGGNPGDPSENHIAILTNGDTATHITAADPGFPIWNGGVINVWVDYYATTNELAVYASTTDEKPTSPLLTHMVDLVELIGNSYAGNDTLYSDAGADLLSGGGGFDSGYYANRTGRVDITIGAGAGDDGADGEGDTVAGDVEKVSGGSGDDELAGNANPLGSVLLGGPGGDFLAGGGGPNDLLSGDAGSDFLTAVDGDGNDTLSCGADDFYLADEGDRVRADCENEGGLE